MISIPIIKDIFLPKKIKSFYLFTQRIVAFEVKSNSVLVTIIRAHREKRTIQKFLEESYDPQDSDSLENALKILLQKIGTYDVVYVALPSSIGVFKTITLPFVNPEKIKLILPFEVEPLLPFSLQDAVIDALISPSKDGINSEVFVAAIKRSTLDAALQPFFAAGIQPEKVTLGALELYELIKTSTLIQTTGLSCIIDFDFETTTIMLLVDGNIRMLRVLAEKISPDALRIDFSVHPTQLPHEIRAFFATIQFTVQAMIKSLNYDTETLSSIIATGIATQCAGIDSGIRNLLECPCTIFQPHKLLHDGLLVLENKNSIAPEYLTSLATALSSPTTEEFNLGRIYNEKQAEQLFKYQVFTAVGLFIFMILSFFIFSFLNTRKLRNEATTLKEEVRKKLKDTLNLELTGKESLKDVIDKAQAKLISERSIWFALSPDQRRSFLYYLYELETHIDANELGLEMKRLAINSDEVTGKDTIRLEGKVRDFTEAGKFTDDLKATKLFDETEIPELQNTTFDIPLTINKNNEVNQ